MGVFQNNLMGAAAAAASAGGADFYDHQIANSVRYQDSENSHMYLSMGTATNVDKYTFSTWFKHCDWTNGEGFVFSIGSGTLENLRYVYSSGAAQFYGYVGNSSSYTFRTAAAFRDPSAWYHLVFTYDSTQSTAADRVKLYVNGVSQSFSDTGYTSMSQNQNSNSDQGSLYVNRQATWSSGTSNEAYFAETIFVDGTGYAASDFGEEKNGVWIPKDPSELSFGNNGFYLKYESSSDLGNDSSGNNNDLTVGNISSHDHMLDSPTFNSSSNGGNFATLNPLNTRGSTGVTTQLTEGNLKWTPGATQDETSAIQIIGSRGVDKVYVEVYCENNSDTGWFGVYNKKDGDIRSAVVQSVASAVRFKPRTGDKVTAGSSSTYIGDGSESNPSGVIFQMAVDVPAGKIWWGRNNAWGSDGADHIDDDNVAFTTLDTDGDYMLFTHTGGASVAQPDWVFNFGQDGTFAGNKTAQGNSDATGYGNFYYSPPTGFKALCAGNTAVVEEVDPAETDDNYPKKLFGLGFWSGSGSQQTISGVGLQPDLFWNIRDRRYSQNNYWVDSSRGLTGSNSVFIETNSTDAEEDFPQDNIVSVNSDGFVISNGTWLNSSGGHKYMAICSRYNGGTTASNSNGSVTSTTQVDPSGHASIVQWAGTSDSWGNAITVGHGLSTTPAFIIGKNRSKADEWSLFLDDYGGTTIGGSNAASNSLVLNTNAAVYTNQSYKGWGGVMPTSTVFTVDGNNLNGVDSGGSGENIVAYCFARCAGWIDVQVYEGNGSTDGPYIPLNNTPAYVWIKRLDSTGAWVYFVKNQKTTATSSDTTFNSDKRPHAWHNLSDAPEYSDTSNNNIDILAQAIKIREDNSSINADGGYYMVFAVAEQPSKYAVAQ